MTIVETLTYDGKTYQIPMFNAGTPYKFGADAVSAVVQSHSPILDAMHKVWDEDNFRSVRLPIPISPALISPHIQSVLDMKIKEPGTEVYTVPSEIHMIHNIIRPVINHAHTVNRKTADYYCYVTHQFQFVDIGQTLRGDHPHIDGLQYINFDVPDQNYMAIGGIGGGGANYTFYNQAFPTLRHLDGEIHDFDSALSETVDRAKEVIYPQGIFLYYDAYTVHRGTPLSNLTYNGIVFCKVTYSKKIFDRLGNTPNPWLAPITFKARPKPRRLIRMFA